MSASSAPPLSSALASSAAPNARLTRIQLSPTSATLAPPDLRLEIVEPAFAERLDAALAPKSRVRIQVENWPLSADTAGVLVSLDGGRPRRVEASRALELGSLTPDGTVLPGAHVLFAVAVDPQGRALRASPNQPRQPFSVVDFYVGRDPAALPEPRAPRVFCVSPQGTSYATASTEQLLDVYSIGTLSPRLPLHISYRGEHLATTIVALQPYVVRGLPWGDIEFSIDAGASAPAVCRVTVNPEVTTQ
ncbi:MAG TPA: hypothetical protein VFQ61_17070 [Polyangiaceae bacterium]|nr:hypothetical protein [Polyangiaceae bacterium]